MVPDWLHLLAIASLALPAAGAVVVLIDLLRHPQHMWIMNLVWPVTALFGSVLWLWAYFRYGRLAAHERAQAAMERDEEMPHQAQTPFPAKVGKGASHCGSGCTLGDICAEWLAFFVPVVATWFGWHWLFQEKMFAVWVVDYLFAFGFGAAFQYFTIKPMRDVSVGEGLKEAVKADTLSLTAWLIVALSMMSSAPATRNSRTTASRLTWSASFRSTMPLTMSATAAGSACMTTSPSPVYDGMTNAPVG